LRSERLPRQGLWQQIAVKLRQDISKGRLAPGSRLVEGDLADRFGVSRGPVREALRNLGQSGLLVSIPHRGVFVGMPSDVDLEEIFLLREALEQAAARLALMRLLPEDIQRLRSLFDSMEVARQAGDSATRKSLDLRFHREIVVIGGSSRLLRAHDDLVAEMLLASGSSMPNWKNWSDDIYPPPNLHGDILEAMAASREDAVLSAIRDHYAWTDDRMIGTTNSGDPTAVQSRARPEATARAARRKRVLPGGSAGDGAATTIVRRRRTPVGG
jgi:DNA-binding GntR family transcriptional regulator